MSIKTLNELFDAAVEIGSENERNAFIENKTSGLPELKHQLLNLLNAHARGNSLLDAPTRAFDLVTGNLGNSECDETVGAVIGNYKLLQKLGEGGMGVVFMAEQLHPIRRKVALKIIREGMNSKQIIARFESEREALARLDHPNVTRILDAGVTNSGRPYFSMELVRGTHLTHYCNSHRVPIEQRLALLEQVCMVIHHAHQKGILHRDIKPSNVMVTLHDGIPVPKVIDFGIAKALDRPLTEQTLFTRYGDLVGTPEYMSPEQAEMSGLDLDVRTDIFSLGVLLYELLTGSTPITQEQIKGKGLLKIFETIRDSEAETPSMRVTRTMDAADTLAEQRQSTAPQLRRSIAGELDWITMKAIAKDRNERYESAAAMAKDIRRFLNGEPVEAAAPTFTYRARKFYQKHKAVSVVATACALLLIASTAVSVYWAISSHRNELLAQQRASELIGKSKALEKEKDRTEQALSRAIAAEKKAEALARNERRRASLTRAQARFHGERVQDQIQKFVVAAKAVPAATHIVTNEHVAVNETPELHVKQIRNGERLSELDVTTDSKTEILQLVDSLAEVSVMISAENTTLWGDNYVSSVPAIPVPAIPQRPWTVVAAPNEVAVSNVTIEPELPMDSIAIAQAHTPVASPISVGMSRMPVRFYEIVVEEERKEFGNSDPFVAIALQAFAEALIAEGKPEKLLAAENNLRESMDILENMPDQPIKLLTSIVLFRVALDQQGKKNQSEAAASKGLVFIDLVKKNNKIPESETSTFHELERLLNSPTDEYKPPLVPVQIIENSQPVSDDFRPSFGRDLRIAIPGNEPSKGQ